jgi:steroid delta-isomerase-like uncharacterized protein
MQPDLSDFTRDLTTAWNEHDIPRILTFYDGNYIGEDVSRATPILGHQGIEQAFCSILRAFPDLHITNQEWVAQENRLAIAWKMQGTQLGAVMNVPPTGRKVSVQGGSFYSLEKRKILHGIHIWDVAGLLRTLRLLPDL